MKTALLDLNVLVALFWPDHEHHSSALRWLKQRGSGRWATCPLTQLGFIRIVSNPAFSREALSPQNAAALLVRNLEENRRHEFWPDSLNVPSAIGSFEARVQGYRQVTDAYLIALAAKRKGIFATFDRGVRELAAGEPTAAIEIVPI